jgi:hemoglobin-like flavoprotein
MSCVALLSKRLPRRSLMANIDSPESIHAKMVELAPMHHRRGVKAEHMPVMGPLMVKPEAWISVI